MGASMRAIQGGTRLLFDSVEGVTNSVERMHEVIAKQATPDFLRLTNTIPARGIIASAVYTAIRGINGTLRESVDHSIGLAANFGDAAVRSAEETRLVAALNGAFGDHLEATNNTLAVPMGFATPWDQLDLERAALSAALPEASPHLVVMVHGLSMSELSWLREADTCLDSQIQQELGSTPLYLRYNTGRHISTNGREFASLLDRLYQAWPVEVESLTLIGHSMGGLVIRSACWYGEQEQVSWLHNLKRVICLGTPHHGSPVERAGHALDVFMQKIPYTRPLAYGKHRSAGIKDLRHGNLLDEDWQGHHPDKPRPDNRTVVPLLSDVDYYFAAATLGRDRSDPRGHLLGDLLVRLDSAVGSHKEDLRRLDIRPENCRVFTEKNHFDLLDDEEVIRQIIDWCSDRPG